MISIHELLSRIKWDPEFGKAVFEIGYYDRVEGSMRRIGLADLVFEPGNKDSFLARDEEGIFQRIPFHRVRQVFRNGELIWERSHV